MSEQSTVISLDLIKQWSIEPINEGEEKYLLKEKDYTVHITRHTNGFWEYNIGSNYEGYKACISGASINRPEMSLKLLHDIKVMKKKIGKEIIYDNLTFGLGKKP